MEPIIEAESQEEAIDIARFIFGKGRNVHQRIDRIIREIMIHEDASVKNLTLAQLEVIMAIHQGEAISITELSRILNVSAPSASTMVDRLVEKHPDKNQE